MSVRALSKYQVALITLVSLSLAVLWFQQPVQAENPETIRPSRNFVVTDDANILTPASKNHIIDQDRQFKKTTQQPQVAVLTVDNTDGLDMKEFTNQLTQRRVWQAGKSGEDNGVIIVFAKNNGQNNVRIAPGSGVESVLPDGKTIVMLENHRDQLKSKDPDQVNQGLMDVFDQVAAQLPTTPGSSKHQGRQNSPYLLPLVVLIALVISFGILILWSHRVTRRGGDTGPGRRTGYRPGYRGYGGGGFFDGFLLGSLLSSTDHHDHDDDDWPPSGESGFSGGDDFGGGSDFSDSAGGGDFGGGGSDI
ncbi:TPM domain-containing protein [Lactobacillaceae bacterium L1_55_11]|nr:TPM domain-containing protein [Lactobacillaceae bacterium L1_55_11]